MRGISGLRTSLGRAQSGLRATQTSAALSVSERWRQLTLQSLDKGREELGPVLAKSERRTPTMDWPALA